MTRKHQLACNAQEETDRQKYQERSCPFNTLFGPQ